MIVFKICDPRAVYIADVYEKVFGVKEAVWTNLGHKVCSF
jgi:hypothetical protein